MEKDLTEHEAWLKETCRELFNQSLMAEQMLGCAFESCVRTKAQIEIKSNTLYSLVFLKEIREIDSL